MKYKFTFFRLFFLKLVP